MYKTANRITHIVSKTLNQTIGRESQKRFKSSRLQNHIINRFCVKRYYERIGCDRVSACLSKRNGKIELSQQLGWSNRLHHYVEFVNEKQVRWKHSVTRPDLHFAGTSEMTSPRDACEPRPKWYVRTTVYDTLYIVWNV